MIDVNKLKERRNAIATEAAAIIERSTKEGTAMTAQEQERFTALEKENADIKATVERAERLSQTQAELGTFKPLVEPKLGLSEKEKKQYSILRALRSIANREAIGGMEREISDEIARQCGKAPTGFYVPARELGVEIQRAADTSTASKMVTQSYQPMIDALRNATLMNKLHATFLGGLVGLVNLPKKTATTSAAWVAEGASTTASNPTVTTNVQLSPKTINAYSDITRSVIQQSSYDMENMVRNDLVASVALAVDSAAFIGSGSSNEPLGLFNVSGTNAIALGTNGAALTWEDLVQCETEVFSDNAVLDPSAVAYVTNSRVRGALKTLPKAGTYPVFAWENGMVNDYPAQVSNYIPSNGTKGTGTNLSSLIFGDFSQLLIGMWGALDITLDPYALATSGGLRIVALQSADIQVRHAESFAKITDIVA